jgi:hypothetical protein
MVRHRRTSVSQNSLPGQFPTTRQYGSWCLSVETTAFSSLTSHAESDWLTHGLLEAFATTISVRSASTVDHASACFEVCYPRGWVQCNHPPQVEFFQSWQCSDLRRQVHQRVTPEINLPKFLQLPNRFWQ